MSDAHSYIYWGCALWILVMVKHIIVIQMEKNKQSVKKIMNAKQRKRYAKQNHSSVR